MFIAFRVYRVLGHGVSGFMGFWGTGFRVYGVLGYRG